MKTNKYDYTWIVQGDCGQGWEDLAADTDRRLARDDLRAYQVNAPGHAYRMIFRRELKEAA